MHILVIDDDPLAGEMTAAVIESLGYETLLASDAVDAMEQLDTHDDIGLIVSDHFMPLISGVELLHTLREQNVTLPFILLSGENPSAALAQTPGLTACLQKDADMEEVLTHTLRQALTP
ncbi:response regulator [Vreelandella salicampi]|uniref:Response regulator n=1 Tax=Vreelandella salicampi TaxID=1449798 RepID=A0A7Z0RVJ6_9GAMM|nr:response regulator [Halomonas salicampi]NYS61806.1 response regulator [Halomonas salicampi]